MAVRTLSEPEVAVVSLDDIGVDPTHNPRTDFNPEELEALEASLEATDGLVQSLAVQRAEEDEPSVYTLVDGERRYRALRAIGVEKAPVLILKTRNAKLAATAANQSRVPLNPIEEAHGINALAELEGLKTNKQIAERIGALRQRVSPEYVAKHRRLLKLPESVQSYIASGVVSVEAERNLRKAVEVSPPLAECACELVRSGAVESRDLIEQFGCVIDRVAASELPAKPVLIDMSHSHLLGELVRDHDAYASLIERYEQATGSEEVEPVIRFTTEEVDAARAAGCLVEFSKGENYRGEKLTTLYLTDTELAADLAVRVVERIIKEAQEAAEEAAREGNGAEGEDAAEAKAKEEKRRERKEARKASEAAHTENTDLGRALIGARGARNRKDNKAAWVDGIAAVLLRDNENLAGASLGLAFEQLQTIEHKTIKATGEQQTKVTYANAEFCRKYLWERIQEARTAEQKLELLAEALIAAVCVDESAVPHSRRIFYSLKASDRVSEILADQIKAVRPKRSSRKRKA